MFHRVARSFQWHKCDPLANSTAAKASLLIPVFGYLVLFNDAIVQNLSFSKLLEGGEGKTLISGDLRLQLVYFGLVFLAFGSVWYTKRRPFLLIKSKDKTTYVQDALSGFPISSFCFQFYAIRKRTNSDNWPLFPFEDKQFENFLVTACGNQMSGINLELEEEVMCQLRSVNSRNDAVARNHEFLTRLCSVYFDLETNSRKLECVLLYLLLILAYAVLLLPSLDMFVSVAMSVFTN